MSHEKLSAVALIALSLSACATVTRGTKQKMQFISAPTGADVTTTTGVKCVTPCTVKMRRKDAFSATFTKQGYQPQTAKVLSRFKGGGAAAGAGNILLGGVIGAVVDGTNGSLNTLTPDPLSVILVPVEVAAAPAAAQNGASAAPAAVATPTEVAPAAAAAAVAATTAPKN